MFLPAWTTSQEPDFKPYQNAAVVFGLFEISGFLVGGAEHYSIQGPHLVRPLLRREKHLDCSGQNYSSLVSLNGFTTSAQQDFRPRSSLLGDKHLRNGAL